MPDIEITSAVRLEQSQAKVIRHMIEQEAKRRARGKSECPGLPLSHIPMLWAVTFRAMIRSGEIEMITVPHSHRPGTVDYVRFASTEVAE